MRQKLWNLVLGWRERNHKTRNVTTRRSGSSRRVRKKRKEDRRLEEDEDEGKAGPRPQNNHQPSSEPSAVITCGRSCIDAEKDRNSQTESFRDHHEQKIVMEAWRVIKEGKNKYSIQNNYIVLNVHPEHFNVCLGVAGQGTLYDQFWKRRPATRKARNPKPQEFVCVQLEEDVWQRGLS